MLSEMARGCCVAAALNWAPLSPVSWLQDGWLLLGMGFSDVCNEGLVVVGAIGTLVAEMLVESFWH